jgi:hypothetical protein
MHTVTSIIIVLAFADIGYYYILLVLQIFIFCTVLRIRTVHKQHIPSTWYPVPLNKENPVFYSAFVTNFKF